MREKLLQLLNEKMFVSGEHIAKKLGVSRTAIWKQIKSLQSLGYKIESVKNKGYRILSRPDIPIPEEITFELGTNIVGSEVFYFKTISSTNNYAKQLVMDDISEGTVVIADVQTNGRGRKNRKWSSPHGGLWFSVILYPHIPPEKGMLVTMTASVAVTQAIEETIGIKSVIKWPNDLLINGKKVCGILTEFDAEMDHINYTIVGIGINVNNQIDDELKEIATTLIEEVSTKISRVKFLRSIIRHFDENYNKLISEDFDSIRTSWFSYANIIGRKIQVQGEKTSFEGIVKDVDNSGCLIVDTDSGSVRVVSGDIIYL